MGGVVLVKKVVFYIKDFFKVSRLIAFMLILSFWFVGEAIAYVFDLPIAGNILGMLLLFVSLKQKWLKIKYIKPASDKLLEFLILFFIPYGVGLMAYWELVEDFWLQISIAAVMSTFLTMYITGIILERFGK